MTWTACILTAWAATQTPTLSVGDPAPKLVVVEYVTGPPVHQFLRGRVYVVDLWATDCPACKKSIPRLTNLQAKYPQIIVIGVSVHEDDFDDVKPFVESKGGAMKYRVAVDRVPDGKGAAEGVMATTWLDASGRDELPLSFLINQETRIAWVGHPLKLEPTLGEVVAGKHDLRTATVMDRRRQAREKKMETVIARIGKARISGTPRDVLNVIDNALRDDPDLEVNLVALKFATLVELNEADRAVECGRKLLNGVFKGDGEALNAMIAPVVDPDRPVKPKLDVLKFALAAAREAHRLDQANAEILDTLACAHFANGETDAAIETMQQAVRVEPDEPGYKDRLARFLRASKK